MVCSDLVDPFTVKTPLKTHSLLALTMIDPAIGWFEIFEAKCYPLPQFIVFKNEGESKSEFKQMCENYGIKAKPTISHNPQANGIIERVHKVENDMLRSFDLENENLDKDNPFKYFLQSTAWTIISIYRTTLQASSC
jgi:hypothetical protein